MYLLDTNIIVYLLHDNKIIDAFFQGLEKKNFAISAITRLEFLVGEKKENRGTEYLFRYLHGFICLPVTKQIINTAYRISRSNDHDRSIRFNDLLIAATAAHLKLPIISADKGFRNIPGISLFMLDLSSRQRS